jgi:tetratricopeptide (TPR) repeat protein
LLACFASLFYNIGLLKMTEEVYVIYTQMVEQNYGLLSVEASNCYYLIGLFYLENSYLKKAMACMKKALEIRLNEVAETHSSISDCYYNIGLIYYVLGNRANAQRWVSNALDIRLKNTGQDNLYVAKVIVFFTARSMRCWRS